jgi:hypothetical protein
MTSGILAGNNKKPDFHQVLMRPKPYREVSHERTPYGDSSDIRSLYFHPIQFGIICQDKSCQI